MLDAANDLFAGRGYEEVSVEDIARSAGVTRGLVHHYFGGRAEVYIALLERLDTIREESLRPPMGRSARPFIEHAVQLGDFTVRPVVTQQIEHEAFALGVDT